MLRPAISCLILLLLKMHVTLAKDEVDSDEELDAEQIGGYFQGDMLMTSWQRSGLRNGSYRWPNATVYYKINSSLDEAHTDFIMRAMYLIENSSCIKFEEATDKQPYFINITNDKHGCFAHVGYLGKVQEFNIEYAPLGKRCFRLGTIVHEMLHSLGFYHQHASAGRDAYIRIIDRNIKKHLMDNFKKQSNKTVHDFGKGYDFNSIMHYRMDAFNKFKHGLTMIPLQPGAKNMGQRIAMSDTDISKLNAMYNCTVQQTESTTNLPVSDKI
ncbi:maker524 [Drosophila busckii]|uniref:Metalloendopeptidase n=1 Tax=Drosophila busckii TaxID=30019 RepID=A0A0M4EGG9_DROBS|nr:seminal metalloprotease 1 [Drosophila busckii]ALC39805.1 maker524 [Drosophila busckii]